MKIVDKINANIKEGKTFFSFEYFPPRTEEGVENLFERLDRMVAYGPTFCDITWGAGGSTADVTLGIATKMQNLFGVETMMHLTCTNMPVEALDNALAEVRKAGLQNILALRGDPPKGQEEFTKIEGGFGNALDLVKYIREKHGDYFGIGVAGYPEAHPDFIVDDEAQMKKNYWDSLAYLKEKIDAGGDFIITQLFYRVERFLQFVEDCRSIGITCPILPGIMPIMTYGGFKRMTTFCKTDVPPAITDALEAIKDNDEAVKALGITLGAEMCKQLLDAGVPGLHMYTLNLERSAVGILEAVGVLDTSKVPRTLPWRQVPATRPGETVRPIFWSNRPKAYLHRTLDWDSFPSGRWGNSRSPAYGTLSDYQFMRRHTSSDKRKDAARAAWGAELAGPEDVADVFVRYCKGEITMLPWAELEGLHSETSLIKEQLLALNAAGYLTINSQPALNGLPSSDPQFGWGGPGGYVYQKAYVEFFCAPEKLQPLLDKLDTAAAVTYIAVNAQGDVRSNMKEESVNAVTWGVFPGREIEQPTVVDPVSFMVWKDEAFDLWGSEWGTLYEEGSSSRKVLADIAAHWWLVSVVDNDHVKGNLFEVFGL
ncbi:hypothetical protein OEZ85_004547 [Tetradesmus obliquus]|uniref:MTHFR SAM-binding regulatory domain-containing protein n=2 Tax=Tetradesmus obliquus TaxID=3088 RepID=A0ABY8UPL6_TETOB|nr:hypothetical protein OEZ85_004547 [Tetradesmus obliquus]